MVNSLEMENRRQVTDFATTSVQHPGTQTSTPATKTVPVEFMK